MLRFLHMKKPCLNRCKIFRILKRITGCLSVNMSGIVVNYIINKTLLNTNIKPVLIKKYINDIFLITDKHRVQCLLTELNNIYHNIELKLKKPTTKLFIFDNFKRNFNLGALFVDQKLELIHINETKQVFKIFNKKSIH